MVWHPISKVAVVSILVGALLLAGPSFGFSSLAIDRGLGVSTAEGSDAYLGIESEGDVTGSELRGNSDPLQIGTIHNNANGELTVRDITVDSIGDDTIDDDIIAVSSPNPGSVIQAGGSSGVTVECADGVSVGQQEVTVRVNRVAGDSLSVAGPTFSAIVDIQCGKGKFSGSTNLTVGDVSPDATAQTISFDIGAVKNNDEVTIDFSDPQQNNGVDYSAVTDGDLTIQSQGHGGDVSFDSTTSQLTYSPQGNEDGEITIEIANIDVVGDSGESYSVTYSDTTGRENGSFFEIQ